MGPRASLPHPHEDPWKASALISAFTHLLLTVLILVHTVLVCITFQLMKWYGWGRPSWNGIRRSAASPSFDRCVNNGSSNPASYACRDSPLTSTERSLKRARSEDWCSVSSKPLVCPKCHGVWSFRPFLSFKDDRGAALQRGETSTCLDEGESSAVRYSHVEAGVRSCQSNSTCRINKIHGDADRLATENSFLETTVSAEESVGKSETPVDFNKRMQTLVQRSQLLPYEEADMVKAEARNSPAAAVDEGKESSVLEQIRPASAGNGKKRVLLESIGSDMASETCRLNCRVGCPGMTQSPLEEVQDETGFFDDDECSVATKGSHDGKGAIRGLRKALQVERKNLCALYAELEVERIASETAANEAMAMISRLQEEKAALHMEAAHYQRMAEEKAIYDEQAMQLLKDILYKKERENYLLEKEVKVIKTRFLREARKVSKRRKGFESTPSFLEGETMLLLKDVEKDLNLEEWQDMTTHSQGVETETGVSVMEKSSVKPPCISWTTEEQPSKRLKSISPHENETNQGLLFAPDTPDVQHQPDIALISCHEKAVNYTENGSKDNVSPREQRKQLEEIAQSVFVTYKEDINPTLDSARALEACLQQQEKEEELDFEGSDQLSHMGRSPDAMKCDVYASEDRDKLLMDPLPLSLVPSPLSERKCMLESCHFSAEERGNQDFCPLPREEAQLSYLHDFCEGTGLEQSGNFLHAEGHNIFSDKEMRYGKVSGLPYSSNDTLARANSDMISGNPLQVPCFAPSSSLSAFGMNSQGAPHHAVTEFLQCSFHDMELVLGDDKYRTTERDMQARLQDLESDSTFQRRPLSLNHRGPGIKFEENDSSIIKSHVH